jgi:ubiquitin-protein ligase
LAAAAASISEDLSMQRHDEETALSAIYGDDFCLEAGAWSCPLYKIRIRRASEVTDHNIGGSNDHKSHRDDTNNKKMELTLQIQLNKKYPCSVPMIQLTNVVGVPTTRMTELLCLLQSKAKECADAGAVMGWELGQVVEEFLVDYSLKLEQENMQRELDLLGQYKKVDDDGLLLDENDLDSYLIGKCYEEELDVNEYDNHSQSSPPSPGRERLDVDIQKEMARQMQALDVAEKIRQRRRQERGVVGVPPSDHHADDGHGCDNDNDDDVFKDFSDDYNQVDFELPPTTGSSTFSRYQTDFVELAPLGRGGGGEVVKAINRLDRRIYAIKRIVLESEDPDHEGEAAKNQRAVIQNQKLRREVTTISRMTHKNIVRYYQAWVESKHEEIPVETTAANTNNALAKTIKEERIKSGSKGDESDSWDSSSYSSIRSSSTSSSSSSSNERMENLIRKPSQQTMDYARSLSLDNFLEHEMNDFSNPFLFHDRDHGEELNYPGVSSTAESDSDLLHSERGQSVDSSRKTLYIQVSAAGVILISSLIILSSCSQSWHECNIN